MNANDKLIQVYEKQIGKVIDDWGRDVTVVWGSTVECTSCEYDPINKEATNSACTTCNGLFYYFTESSFPIKGVFKSFLGNMGFVDFSLQKYGYDPGHDARLTCWLADVLETTAFPKGLSYLDQGRNIRVEIDGKNYSIISSQRSGADKLKVVVSTLKEIQ